LTVAAKFLNLQDFEKQGLHVAENRLEIGSTVLEKIDVIDSSAARPEHELLLFTVYIKFKFTSEAL